MSPQRAPEPVRTRRFSSRTITGLLLALIGAGLLIHNFKGTSRPVPSFVDKTPRTRNVFDVRIFDHIEAAKSRAGKMQLPPKTIGLVAYRIANNTLSEVVVSARGVSNTPGYEIDPGKKNGFNTPYEVSHPPGYVVLAINRFGRGVYVPYNQGLDVPVIRRKGLEYLYTNLRLAKDDLLQAEVKSRAYPGKRIDEVMPTEDALALSLIEHIDPARLKKSSIEDLANEVLVTIGCNGPDAYLYAVSKGAHARGLFQFYRPTYISLPKKYPKAGLIKDFVAGTADHKNAAKATLLLFDSALSLLTAKVSGSKYAEGRKWMGNHPDEQGKYLAASYNCGAGHILAAIGEFKDDWVNHIKREPHDYLTKYIGVKRAMTE